MVSHHFGMEGGRIPVVGAGAVRCERELGQDRESLIPAQAGTPSKGAGPERPLALPIPATEEARL